jgi:hypothetical protein
MIGSVLAAGFYAVTRSSIPSGTNTLRPGCAKPEQENEQPDAGEEISACVDFEDSSQSLDALTFNPKM